MRQYIKINILLCVISFMTSALLADTSLKFYQEDWKSHCTSKNKYDEKVCRLERSVYTEKKAGSGKIATIIFYSKPKQIIEFALISPLGLSTEQGATILLDNQEVLVKKNLPFTTCQHIGCIHHFKIDNKTLKRLERAKFLSLNYKTVTNQDFSTTIPLTNFSTELKKIL